MHPSRLAVESLVHKELAPGHRTIGIEPFFTDHLQFGAEEKRGMRIYQKKRVMVRGVRRRNGHPIRTARLFDFVILRRSCGGRGALAVKRFELREVHTLDVAPNASLRETERHP